MAKSDFLASLISGEVSKLGTSSAPGLLDIPLDQIHDNPRNFFPVTTAGVQQLAESIQISGIQQPPVVCPAEDGGYRLVAGHRRTAAVRLLHEQEPNNPRWKSITCRVSHYSSPEAEELALIVTNTEVRQNSWEWTSQAATRTGELLCKLQEEQGVKLPGRTRDHVAELLQISKSKVARAQYIQSHLLPAVKAKLPPLPEDVAYAIAHLRPEWQKEIAKRYRKKSAPSRYNVKEWEDAWNAGSNPFDLEDAARQTEKAKGPTRRCSMTGGSIPKSECDKLNCDYKCCCECPEVFHCASPCQRRTDNIRLHYSFDQGIAVRIRTARMRAGKPEMSRIEQSQYHINNVEQIATLAKKYGTSTDYLLGLTDSIEPPGWQPITETSQPPAGERVIVVSWVPDLEIWVEAQVKWIPALVNDDPQMWMPLPEAPSEEKG